MVGLSVRGVRTVRGCEFGIRQGDAGKFVTEVFARAEDLQGHALGDRMVKKRHFPEKTCQKLHWKAAIPP